jgi:purine nucleosidase
MAHKIILDTDIGSDIDDAVCLAYLLAQPECHLLGITTVSGEPEKRAMLASAQCRVAGREVPIYPGAADPLIIPQKQTQAHQAVALQNWSHATDFPKGEAVEFLRHTIRAHPGEITLLTIGPLTNIALLFSVDPEIPALLRGLVMMCGVFTEHLPNHSGKLEWNALLDPHATAIVYRARPPIHRSIGLDVTTQVKMPAAEVRARFQTKLLRPVLDFAEVWFEQRDAITFHDPLAAATIFDGDICRFEVGDVTVELNASGALGQTIWHPESTQIQHEVALGVNSDRFFQHYFSLFDRE